MNNNSFFFSVITIVYNDVGHIESTIKSVLGQTYTNYEYIIIDGGSTDGTVEIIKKYQDRITTWVSESDGGIYPAMNKGVALARGRVLNFMNCDDYYHDENVLQKVVNKFGGEDAISFVLGRGSFIDNQGAVVKRKGKIVTTSLNASRTEGVCHQAFFYKKSLHVKFGLYDLRYKICADGLFMYTVYHSDKVKGSFLDLVLAIRRKEGISGSTASILEHKKMFDEVFGKSFANRTALLKPFLKAFIRKTRFGRFLFDIYLFFKNDFLRR